MKPLEKVLNYSQKVLEYNHHTADYYENKKFMFLKISVALLGFSATFIAALNLDSIVKIGGLVLLTCSVASLLSFAFLSLPTYIQKRGLGLRSESSLKQDIKSYKKKFENLKEKDMLNENTIQSFNLLNLISKKRKVINIMSFFIILGLVFFFVSVLVNTL